MNIKSISVNAALLSAMLAVIPKPSEHKNQPHTRRIMVDWSHDGKGIELAATDGVVLLFAQDKRGSLEKTDDRQCAFLDCTDSDKKLYPQWRGIVKYAKKYEQDQIHIEGGSGEITYAFGQHCNADPEYLPAQSPSTLSASHQSVFTIPELLSIVHLPDETIHNRIKNAICADYRNKASKGNKEAEALVNEIYAEISLNDSRSDGDRQLSPYVLTKLGTIGERLHANLFMRNHPAHMIKCAYDMHIDQHCVAKAYALTIATKKAWRNPDHYDQFFGADRAINK